MCCRLLPITHNNRKARDKKLMKPLEHHRFSSQPRIPIYSLFGLHAHTRTHIHTRAVTKWQTCLDLHSFSTPSGALAVRVQGNKPQDGQRREDEGVRGLDNSSKGSWEWKHSWKRGFRECSQGPSPMLGAPGKRQVTWCQVLNKLLPCVYPFVGCLWENIKHQVASWMNSPRSQAQS